MFLLQNIDIDYLNVAVHHCQAPNTIIIFRYWGYNVNYVVTTMLCDRTNKNRTQHFPTHSGSHITIVISGVVGTNTRTVHKTPGCSLWKLELTSPSSPALSAQCPVSQYTARVHQRPVQARTGLTVAISGGLNEISQYLVLLSRHLSTKLSILLSSFKGLL